MTTESTIDLKTITKRMYALVMLGMKISLDGELFTYGTELSVNRTCLATDTNEEFEKRLFQIKQLISRHSN